MGNSWQRLSKEEQRKRKEAGEAAELTFARQIEEADLHDLVRIDQSYFGRLFSPGVKRPDFRLENPGTDIEVKAFTEQDAHFHIKAREVKGLRRWERKKANGRPIYLAIYHRHENRAVPSSLRVIPLADWPRWDETWRDRTSFLAIPCSHMQPGPAFFEELKQRQLGFSGHASAQAQALIISSPRGPLVPAPPSPRQGRDEDDGILDIPVISTRRLPQRPPPRPLWPWLAAASVLAVLALAGWAGWGRAIHPRSWTASRASTIRIASSAPAPASAWARGGAIPAGEVAGFLLDYLPAGVSVEDVVLSSARQRPDGTYRFTYAFRLATEEPLLQALPAPVPPGPGFRAFLDRLQYDPALPPGQKWVPGKTVLYPAGATLRGVLECAYDPATRAATADLPLLPGVTRAAVDADRAKASLLEAELARRYEALEQDIAASRRQRLAQLPAPPRRDNPAFGGPGSGEPTRTGTRAAAGAAAGASLGALAGNNRAAAGIGAASGLFAGLIYDMVSKDNDRKRQQAQADAAYAAALQAYRREAARADADADAYAARRRDAFAAEIPSWNLPLLR